LKGKDQPLYIEFSELHDIMRHACSVCKNFSNFYSDISFGGLGSKDGFTTSIIRTDLGEKIYKLAIDKGYIEEPPELNTSVEKSKMLAKIISFSRMKTKRAEDALKHLPL
ncbi:MAG: Coenzyme F420 hydrogenase/dehydrogenase, beta subunit C-terminal domain, partial [Candidatus Lokiarchaeota archaeon]|nr:Coenzyme F420 hydrogenase/dehydrogenase, beta subunit C-terminal domain [Candidatus Lokiarchaeota archaeon]